MRELIADTALVGVLLTIAAYLLGVWVKRRLRLAVFNPLLISLVIIIGVLLLFDVEYESYKTSCDLLSLMVTPATVCFAVPLYRQLRQLKDNYKAILGGIMAGVLTSAVTIFVVAKLFSLPNTQYVTLLPKSITAAIALGVSNELGGIAAITIAAIMVTGIFGNMAGATFCRLLRITEPVAVGVALGTSAHIMGTASAVELGEVEGAMGGLSIVVAGLLTVVVAPLFAGFIA